MELYNEIKERDNEYMEQDNRTEHNSEITEEDAATEIEFRFTFINSLILK